VYVHLPVVMTSSVILSRALWTSGLLQHVISALQQHACSVQCAMCSVQCVERRVQLLGVLSCFDSAGLTPAVASAVWGSAQQYWTRRSKCSATVGQASEVMLLLALSGAPTLV
jgi:hypothetical protein